MAWHAHPCLWLVGDKTERDFPRPRMTPLHDEQRRFFLARADGGAVGQPPGPVILCSLRLVRTPWWPCPGSERVPLAQSMLVSGTCMAPQGHVLFGSSFQGPSWGLPCLPLGGAEAEPSFILTSSPRSSAGHCAVQGLPDLAIAGHWPLPLRWGDVLDTPRNLNASLGHPSSGLRRAVTSQELCFSLAGAAV